MSWQLPRDLQPELMDDPALDPFEHARALDGLARLNSWSGSARILWKPVRQLYLDQAPRPLRVLDLACGGGDVAVGLAKRAAREKLPIQIDGCDKSEVALEHARQNWTQHQLPGKLFACDIFKESLPKDYDLVCSSLFLHHLSEEQAIEMLVKIRESGATTILINDLRRTRFGLWLAHIAVRIFTNSPVVHFDGPASVRAAYTMTEAVRLAQLSGLKSAQVVARWPQRFLLSWSKE